MTNIDSTFLEEISRRRSFAIISHPDAGKTTLTEKLILHGGVIREAGEVRGAKPTTSDWMALEQKRGISITSSVLQFDYGGLRLNLLDTPGHKDFSEDTYRTLVAADSAVMLIDVAKGVEERTRKLYEVCRRREIPIFTFINKCDREGKVPLELLDEIESTLQMRCYPVTWPLGVGGLFRGVYHRIKKQFILYAADDPQGNNSNSIIRNITGLDDPAWAEVVHRDILQQVREEIELIDGTLGDFSKEDFLAGRLSPVHFASAKLDFAIDTFLDLFVQEAPPPSSRKARIKDSSEEITIRPEEPFFSGFIFKIQANMDRRHRDRIAFMRICSGRFERGMKVDHVRLGREVRLAFSSQFLAQERETVDVAYAGDIVGVGDSRNFQIGDTVTNGKPILYGDIPQFTPELFARVAVSDAMKRQKLQKALQHLAEEGAVQLFIDPRVGNQDPIIGVVGELQFDVLLFRLEDEYSLEGRLVRLPYTVVRWPRRKLKEEDSSSSAATSSSFQLQQSGHRFFGPAVEALNGNIMIYRDNRDQPVILLEKEWDLNWLVKENPDIEFVARRVEASETQE